MKILNNKSPKIDPYGTPNNISFHELYLSFIFILCFLLERKLCISFTKLWSRLYASILAIKSS